MKNFRNFKPGSAEFVVLHAKWRIKRGKKGPSLPFLFEKNPQEALKLAERLAYFPINGKYLQGANLDKYACSNCGATHVKLWRPYANSCVTLLCAKCAAEKEEKDISTIDSKGLIDSNLTGKTDQIGNYIPAVPTEDMDNYWGYTSVPGPGVDWWKELPTLTPDNA